MQPSFKQGQKVFASRIGMGAGACWQFDEPVTVLGRTSAIDGAFDGQPTYLVRYDSDKARLVLAAESLSEVAVSYPRLTWLEVLEARGLPRPAGF